MAKKLYDKINGKEIYLYALKNGNVEAEICEMGARINSLKVNGTDIAFGFNSVEDYLKSGCYAGATIGRVANRIAKGRFTLNGKEYSLAQNDGENHLHGGNEGFDKKYFTVTEYSDNCVTMRYVSPDGEENYSGNLTFTVRFCIENNFLRIDYAAASDKDTLWCPTNHSYFNLDGEASGDCRGNLLTINAEYYTPVDGGLIPTGEKRSVKNTPFDFTKPKKIGADLDKDELKISLGYDHNFVLNGNHVARAESMVSGIKMDVYTDMPCLQFYSGGQLDGVIGKNGKYFQYAGFCLEPQFCPDAINMQDFEKPYLKKGETKTHYIEFKFS